MGMLVVVVVLELMVLEIGRMLEGEVVVVMEAAAVEEGVGSRCLLQGYLSR